MGRPDLDFIFIFLGNEAIVYQLRLLKREKLVS